jgi:hypothetical protein
MAFNANRRAAGFQEEPDHAGSAPSIRYSALARQSLSGW